MKMNKRVYGVIGISSIMANWNADFSGNPKQLSNGEIFGSDKALKFTMKKKWQSEGKKVLYVKSFKIDKYGLQPRNLKERYEKIFDVELKGGKKSESEKNSEEVLKNLFSAIDVKNFGATFAESGNNISITGAVQIGQGMNKYRDSRTQEQQILSPFRDATDDKAQNSTLGTKIVSDEAHYFYPFAINPMAYSDYEELNVTEGYTEEDYAQFKEASLNCATSFASNSKIGANNEFAMFVETEENIYLPNLSDYIRFEKSESINVIEFVSDNFLEKIDGVKKIEIYYNPNTTELREFPKNAEIYNIITNEGIN